MHYILHSCALLTTFSTSTLATGSTVKIVDPKAERKVAQSHQVGLAYKNVNSHLQMVYEHQIGSIASSYQ